MANTPVSRLNSTRSGVDLEGHWSGVRGQIEGEHFQSQIAIFELKYFGLCMVRGFWGEATPASSSGEGGLELLRAEPGPEGYASCGAVIPKAADSGKQLVAGRRKMII